MRYIIVNLLSTNLKTSIAYPDPFLTWERDGHMHARLVLWSLVSLKYTQ